MDNVLADINIGDPTANVDRDVEMADIAPRAVQKQEKQKKDKKEKNSTKEGREDKRKKRKHGEMNGDGEVQKAKKAAR